MKNLNGLCFHEHPKNSVFLLCKTIIMLFVTTLNNVIPSSVFLRAESEQHQLIEQHYRIIVNTVLPTVNQIPKQKVNSKAKS